MGVEWTRKSDWSTDSKKKAILSTFRHLVAVSMSEFRHYYESLCMTAGNGVLGTVTSSSTGGGKDTIVMNTDGFDVRLLRFGQFVSVYASDLLTRRTHTGGSSLNGEAPIDLYDQAAFTIRVDGSTGATVAGDKVVVSGLTATPPVSVLGVAYHHSDASTGTWLGLDRAANPEVRANRVSGAAGFSLPMVRLMLNKTGVRLGKEQMKGVEIWTHQRKLQCMRKWVSSFLSIPPLEQVNLCDCSSVIRCRWLVRRSKHHSSGIRLAWMLSLRAIGDELKLFPQDTTLINRVGNSLRIRSSDGGVAAADIFYIVNGGNIYP